MEEKKLAAFIQHHRTYTKINTLYKRYTEGPLKNQIIIGDFSRPEFKYLYNCLWDAEEKVDGTNVFWYWDGTTLEIHGKSANADIPKHLKKKMEELVTVEMMQEIFPAEYDENGNKKELNVRIYGEGYGVKIQKGGNYIKNDCGVRVFDVMINGWWLDRDAKLDIAAKLNLPTCYYYGQMTLKEAEEMVRRGFKSPIAENTEYEAEGLVLKPTVQLFNKQGERIIVKIKTVDYRNLIAKSKA